MRPPPRRAQEEQQLATEPLPLTEYELQRQRNIAAIREKCESLQNDCAELRKNLKKCAQPPPPAPF